LKLNRNQVLRHLGTISTTPTQRTQSGLTAGYIDLGQIGFSSPHQTVIRVITG
jgi:hypothetical protein